jgi:sigma-B regulation protein RsbU (phosphoserine phosphatase)
MREGFHHFDQPDRLAILHGGPCLHEGRFLTLILGVLSPTGQFTYANAGHGPAMLALKHETLTLAAHRPPLGIGIEGLPTEPASFVQLSPGDRIFFASDGLTEAMDFAGNMPTLQDIQSIIADKSLQPIQVLANLQSFLATHTKGRKLSDDLTMICLDYVAPQP